MEEKDELTLLRELKKQLKTECNKLNGIALQFSLLIEKLTSENKFLKNLIEDKTSTELYTRLDFLFRVIEHESKFDSLFVSTCSEEIEKCLIKNE